MGVMCRSISITSQRHESDWHVPNELIERLLRADEPEVAEVVAVLSPRQRGHLAVFCYARAHLQQAAQMHEFVARNSIVSNARRSATPRIALRLHASCWG